MSLPSCTDSTSRLLLTFKDLKCGRTTVNYYTHLFLLFLNLSYGERRDFNDSSHNKCYFFLIFFFYKSIIKILSDHLREKAFLP